MKTFLIGTLAAMLAGVASAHPFSRAESVWGEDCSKTNSYLRFRTKFTARAGERPRLRVTASTVYRATLNGEYVGYGPARAAEGYFKVDEWPLAGVRQGVNELEVEVAGYADVSYQYVIQPGFLQAEVVSGDRVLAATPADFAATEIPRDRGGPVYSRQRGFPSERYVVDSAAAERPVALVKGPAVRYLPRGVPYPEFRVQRYFSLTNTGAGTVWEAPFNDSGFLGFKVRVAEPGVFAVRFEEAFSDGRIDPFRNGDPAETWHGTRNLLVWDVKRPGEYEFETFEPYTLKYVEARMESGRGEISDPYLRQFRNPHPERAQFVSSDPDVDRIFRAACDTLAENGVDLYTDCPGRERSAWLCDSWFSAQAAAYLTGDFGIERSYLEMFAMAPRFNRVVPEGGMPGSYPGLWVMPVYALWYVLQCEAYAGRAAPADAESFLALARKRIEKTIGFMTRFENADGLLADLPGMLVIEWSKANDLTKGVNYPANMLWAAALDAAAGMYARDDWAKRAERLRETIRRRSFDGRYFCDQELNGRRVDARSEVCQYYAFFTRTATKSRYGDLLKRMLGEFGPDRTADGLYPVGMFFGRLLRFGFLSHEGQKAKFISEMKQSLLGQVRETGTFWEFADGHDSRCHAFASYVALLLVRDVVGLTVDHSKRKVTLADGEIPIDHGVVRLPVREGTIELKFHHRGGRVVRELRLPSGWR